MSADAARPFEPRTVEIRPPSLREETTIVVRLAVVIVAIVGFYLANTAWRVDGAPARASGLLPYQTLVSDAVSGAQLMFRELQEGLLEAERVRSDTGEWPAPDALADQGVPPFTKDPTARGPAYRWIVTHRGAFINYRGIPGVTGAPAWLLLIQEPLPDSLPDPSPEDEEHHRLAGGMMLHVSVWTHADGSELSPALVQMPQNEGWIQMRVNPPSIGYAPPPTVKTP
ncbi:MAG: hypothetical protein HY048_19400 [Acidobacteria bacterium]|nr:hypothetical protein [Acidobacteriota bacterium]